MTHDRIQRLELENAVLWARVRKAENDAHERCHTKLREAVYAIERISAERDRARNIAVRLEQELAAVEQELEAVELRAEREELMMNGGVS